MISTSNTLLKGSQSHRYAKSLLETILEAVPTPIFFKDRQGRYLGCNSAFAQMTGVDADTLRGKTVMDLWPGDLALAYHEKDLALIRNPCLQEYEFRVRRWDGEIRDVIFSKNVFLDESGNVAGIVGAFTDISEIQAARKQAEVALRTKDRFLANLNHEVRTPLNGILGMAQLLLFPDLSDDDRKDFAQTIYRSGQNLLAMLNAIIDLSMVEAGVLQLHPCDFDPALLVDGTKEVFAQTAREKGLTITSSWDGETSSHYRGDWNRLQQMLANLMENAIKFSENGEIRLEARPISLNRGKDGIEFVVSDTGIGIPGDKLSQLFQPFTQTDDSETRRHQGAGLGLSVVSKLATLMRGKVGAESEPGKGSRFWFRVALEKLPPEVGSDGGANQPVSGPTT